MQAGLLGCLCPQIRANGSRIEQVVRVFASYMPDCADWRLCARSKGLCLSILRKAIIMRKSVLCKVATVRETSLLVLASAALLLNAGIAQAAARAAANHMSAPPVEIVTPPTASSSVPPPSLPVNPGEPSGPAQFGTPPVNSGAIGPLNPTITNQSNFGALPGNPGSATYDPNAALPSPQ
jgi:hypothetical protein